MYVHKQKGPIGLFFFGISIVMFVTAWFAQGEPVGALTCAGIGTLIALVALCIQSLTVVDKGDCLVVRFGLLPVFRTEIPYKDMKKIEIERWKFLPPGIHFDGQGNSIWSLWGRSCVVIHRRMDILRIGTNDAENLARFLEGKVGQSNGK